MSRATLSTALMVLLMVMTAWADVVHLKDGSTREGRIVEETDQVIALEMRVGGVPAVVRIPRADVARIEKKKTQQDLLSEELLRRRQALKPDDLDGLEQLARWCREKELFAEAASIYADMEGQGETGYLRGKLGTLEMEFERGRINLARQVAEEVKEKFPEDPKVLAWLKRLDDTVAQGIAESLLQAVTYRQAGDPAGALRTLEMLLARSNPTEIAPILVEHPFPHGEGLYEFMAEARLARVCPAGPEGLLVCRTCRGTGILQDSTLCSQCRGSGKVVCPRCQSAGMVWDTVPVEQRPEVVKILARLADEEDLALARMFGNISDPDLSIEETWKSAEQALYHAGRARLFRDRAIPLSTEGAFIKDLEVKRQASAVFAAGILCSAAARLENAGNAKLKAVESAPEGLLAHTGELIEAANLLGRSLGYADCALDTGVVVAEMDLRGMKERLTVQTQTLSQAVARNVRALEIYDMAVRASQTGRPLQALQLLVELVNNISPADAAYLSARFQKTSPMTLAQFMAGLRFELGKERADFGEPTDYEKQAFVERLLTECDGAAQAARESYQEMRDARDHGRGAYVPASKVEFTKRTADHARDWYKALLRVKYPFPADIVIRVHAAIDEMDRIVEKCRNWYRVPPPVVY